MAAITQIIAHVVTADFEDASTGSWVYLGIGGREFSLDTHGIDFCRGSDAFFRLGEESNVKYPDYNDPRYPPLHTEDLPHFPAYLRLETAGDDPAWALEWVSVRVNPDGGGTWRYTNPSLRRDARRHSIWLDTGYGKALYLRPDEDFSPRH